MPILLLRATVALAGLITKIIPYITRTQPGKIRFLSPDFFVVDIFSLLAFIDISYIQTSLNSLLVEWLIK